MGNNCKEKSNKYYATNFAAQEKLSTKVLPINSEGSNARMCVAICTSLHPAKGAYLIFCESIISQK